MNLETVLLFAAISQFTVALPFLTGLIRAKQLTSFQKLVFYLVCISLVTEVLAYSFINFFHLPNNLVVYNLFALVQFVLIWWMFKRELSELLKRNFFLFSLVIYILFAILSYLFYFKTFLVLNYGLISLSNLFFLIMGFAYFYKLLKVKGVRRLENDPIFWFSSGLIVYNSSAFILFLMMSYVLTGSNELMIASLFLNALFNIFQNIFFGITLYVKPKSIDVI